MLKFQRRRVGCWNVCDDYDHIQGGPAPVLTFDSEDELFAWIKKTLPFTQDESEHTLQIRDGCVVFWTVLGFLISE